LPRADRRHFGDEARSAKLSYVARTVSRTRRRAAAAMCSASIPAAAMELVGLARLRHLAHRELHDARRFLFVGECREHRVPEPALGPVVFDRHESPVRRLDCITQSGGVERLDRVEVDDARRDVVLGQRVRRGERLVDRDPGGDERDLVVLARAEDATPADLELLVGPVQDSRRGAEGAQVADPAVSAIAATRRAVWFASQGCSTVLPCTARSEAMSSRPICEGPSSPIETPAWEPQSDIVARLTAAMRTKSYARDRKAAKVEANGRQPTRWSPTAAATICCSAMYISKYRSGNALANSSANVEFDTSPSRATTSDRAAPSAASASP
jgi:hypothetical protein